MFHHTAYIALGANLGDRQETLNQALIHLRADADLCVEAVSDFIDTEAVGGPAGQPRYLNGAAKISTALTPRQLLQRLLKIELGLGRTRVAGECNAPRTLDLDLLLYDDLVLDEPGLQVPHPRMHLRRFVLEPLAQIEPSARHPVLKKTMRELLEKL